jgi:hypothetical protein
MEFAHLKTDRTRAEMTPAEWLKVGSQVGRLANTWSGRGDLVAYVGPGAGGDAPARFSPDLAEVEVNVSRAFGENVSPETIGDLTDRNTLFDWPRAAGAIFHEALHARYSRFDVPKELTRHQAKALVLLEESRIEAHGVINFPQNKVFLRASALDLVLQDIYAKIDALSSQPIRSIASLAALTCARVDAGSLQDTDVDKIKTIVLDFFGQEVYDELRSIWTRFQAHDDHFNPARLVELAIEWDNIISRISEERGEDSDLPQDVKDAIDAIIGDIVEAIEESSEDVAIAIGGEVQDQQRDEDWKEEASARAKAAKQQREHEKESSEVFSKDTSAGEFGGSGSRLRETRLPTGEERAAAVKIAKMLEKAKYRERDEKEISSVLPPGRLRARAMVQNAAYRDQGSMQMAEPWRRVVRKHTDDPMLKIGVMVDISGSMGDAMQPMAVTAWAMSEAARRVQARAAMVYYGQDVFPTLKPGQHLNAINVFTAPDGTEKFDKAFKALDGSLGLLHGTGARLLVIVSDMCYTPQETQKAKEWLQECDKAGVAVIVLPFSEVYQLGYSQNITRGTKAVLLSNVRNPAEAAVEIGQAAANALSQIGRSNAA